MNSVKSKIKVTGTIAEAAALLRVGRNQAYELARDGVIPTIDVGPNRRKIVKWQELLRKLGATDTSDGEAA